MIIDQRYKEVKAGTFSKESFLAEARKDPRISKYITGFTTFEEAVSVLKSKSYIFESDQAPTKKFSVTGWMNESINDEINEPKGTVNSDAVNAFEYDKGWRYELKAIGKFDDESIQKAQAKAVKALEKDALYYTKLEMQGEYPDDKGRKALDVSNGKNLTDPDNQSKPVKAKAGESADTEAYTKKMYELGKAAKKKSSLNEAETTVPYSGDKFSAEDQIAFVVDMATGKIVKGSTDVGKAVDIADDLNQGRKATKNTGFVPFRTKDLKGVGLNHRDKNDWASTKDAPPVEKSILDKLRALLGKVVKESSALDDLTRSHENDKNPLVQEECPDNKLPGGKGDKLSAADVDQEELSMGLSVESEHTDDPEIAKEIVLDHLAEDPQYYTHMKEAGLEEKVQQLKESIRKVVRAKLIKEGYGVADTNKSLDSFIGKSLLGLTISTLEPGSETLNIKLKNGSGDAAGDLIYSYSKDEFPKILSGGEKMSAPNTDDISTLVKIIKIVNPNTKLTANIPSSKSLKEYSYVPEPAGEDVDRKELKRLLQGVTWPAEGEPNNDKNQYPDNGYTKRIGTEKADAIKRIIDRLGQEGIDLYNEYAPEGCKWGEDAEEAVPQIRQDIKDLEDLDPKDLAKKVIDKEFDVNSVKSKAAVKLLGQAIEDGNKDPEVKKAFMLLADQFKKK